MSGAADRAGRLPQQLRAASPARGAATAGVVDRDRVALDVLELDLSSCAARDVRGHPLAPRRRRRPGAPADRVRIVPSRNALSGMTLFVDPASMCADGDHRGVEDVHPAGHHRLQGQHDLGGHRDRVGGEVRLEACPPRPRTVIRHWSAAAIIGPGRTLIAAAGQGGDAVQRERAAHRRLRDDVQQPLLEHVAGAVEPLLPRLDHEHDLPGELVAALGEQPGGAEQHRHVGVVPAGVHGPGHLGGERQPGVLLHRQRVHVAAQQVGRTGAGAAQHADDGARRRPGAHLDRQIGERLEDGGLGPRQVQPDLGQPVQLTAQIDGAVGVVVGGGEQLRGAGRHAPTLPHPALPRPPLPGMAGQPAQAGRAVVELPDQTATPGSSTVPARLLLDQHAVGAAQEPARPGRHVTCDPAVTRPATAGRRRGRRSTQPDAARCTSCAGAAVGVGAAQVALQDARAVVAGHLVVLEPRPGAQHGDVAGGQLRRRPSGGAASRRGRRRRRRPPGARAGRTRVPGASRSSATRSSGPSDPSSGARTTRWSSRSRTAVGRSAARPPGERPEEQRRRAGSSRRRATSRRRRRTGSARPATCGSARPAAPARPRRRAPAPRRAGAAAARPASARRSTSVAMPDEWPLGKLSESSRAPPSAKSRPDPPEVLLEQRVERRRRAPRRSPPRPPSTRAAGATQQDEHRQEDEEPEPRQRRARSAPPAARSGRRRGRHPAYSASLTDAVQVQLRPEVGPHADARAVRRRPGRGRCDRRYAPGAESRPGDASRAVAHRHHSSRPPPA